MNYLAFDLEIADEFPETGDPDLTTLGISCAATYDSAGNEKVWHSDYAPRMTPEDCRELFCYLYQMDELGYPTLTWNGLGFDFPVLMYAMELGEDERALQRQVGELAKRHYDPGFTMICMKGYMIQLVKAAAGLELGETKTEGMSGALAPIMWKEGREKQAKVLEYCLQDTRLTGWVMEAMLEFGTLPWISNAGNPTSWSPYFLKQGRMLTCAQSMRLPPVKKWGTFEPWDRDEKTSWLNQ